MNLGKLLLNNFNGKQNKTDAPVGLFGLALRSTSSL